MKFIEKKWDFCEGKPWRQNFDCKLINSGKWKKESEKYNKLILGKYVFVIQKKDGHPLAPTFADQRNFMTGLLEVERLNDNVILIDGKNRCEFWGNPPNYYFQSTLLKFKECLLDYEQYSGCQIPLLIPKLKIKDERDNDLTKWT